MVARRVESAILRWLSSIQSMTGTLSSLHSAALSWGCGSVSFATCWGLAFSVNCTCSLRQHLAAEWQRAWRSAPERPDVSSATTSRKHRAAALNGMVSALFVRIARRSATSGNSSLRRVPRRPGLKSASSKSASDWHVATTETMSLVLRPSISMRSMPRMRSRLPSVVVSLPRGTPSMSTWSRRTTQGAWSRAWAKMRETAFSDAPSLD
mmetsp:Transcript_24502/g.84121  ORF Transcript_24502/g.84121 Transcript_24502/m.84121 type:complete len:209 (+) Transcript_24502:237-863(+)